jgi:hypothetical protein
VAPADEVTRPESCLTEAWITRVEGTVVAEDDAPMADVRPQLCVRTSPADELVCLSPPRTDTAGAFVINVPASAQCMRHAVMRVLLPGADKVTAYCPLDLPLDRPVLSLAQPYVLYDTLPVSALPPRGDANAARTVSFAEGLEVEVTPVRLVASGEGYAALASRRLLPSAPGLCFLGPAPPVVALWAFSPEASVDGAAFPLRLPNATALPAASTVDLYLLGGLSCDLEDGTPVAEGEWRSYDTATVSGDGAWVEGGSLPCFTWLGYAPH